MSSTLILASCCATSSFANEFELCRERLKERAGDEGYSSYIVNDVISALSPNKKVISYDNNQAEFVESFAQYTKARVNDFRIKKGREQLKKHQGLLKELSQKYGVPAQYLVAFWGLETNYGRNKGKMSVLNSLATLACDQRRSEYFTNELFNLFYLIDNKTVSVEQLKGSWAGAMGHMQFMPTAFRQYTLDGDKDGKIDVWQSEVDALTSAANYLNKIGWQKETAWGVQVTLPKSFEFANVDFDKSYPISHFQQMGIITFDGKPLSSVAATRAEIVLPAGYTGPAFLVFDNFHVIMKWNLSKSYALSVGGLADELTGKKGITLIGDESKQRFRKADLKKLQSLLQNEGYSVGKPDGLWGPKTRKALRAYQLSNQLIADGFPNPSVFDKAGISL